MRSFRATILLAAWLTAGAGTAAAQRAIPDGKLAGGVLSFDGRATVGDFTGTTTAVRGEMTGGADLSEVRGWVEAPVKTLETGNGKRDKDLNKSMESDEYPTIRFDLAGVAPGPRRGDSVAVTLLGTFRIHGVTRKDSIPATVVLGPDRVRVRGTTPLNVKDYRIGGLSKAFGMLRMDEEILVHLDLTFALHHGTGSSSASTKGRRP
jgi:polyisoprenoid-binding protein YceI